MAYLKDAEVELTKRIGREHRGYWEAGGRFGGVDEAKRDLKVLAAGHNIISTDKREWGPRQKPGASSYALTRLSPFLTNERSFCW